jgi:opacity protein-like surface antigen
MKKSLIALALIAACAAASAQTTISAEYDLHKIKNSQRYSNYGAVGLTQGTKYGNFDGWLQGMRQVGNHESIDNIAGFEVGYSYALPVTNKLTVTPRIAYGELNGINIGTRDIKAKYQLTTVEGSYALTGTVAPFVGLSHTRGVNADAIHSWNRVTAGVDYALSKNTSLRVGLSHIQQPGVQQDGAFTILSYTLN